MNENIELKIKAAVLKNSFELLDMFYEVLSDEHFPTNIGFFISEEKLIKKDDLWAKYFHKNEEKIPKIHKEILDIEEKLIENFNWTKKHITRWSNPSKQLLENIANKDVLNHLFTIIIKQIIEFVSDWNKTSEEISNRESDESIGKRILLIHGENKSILILFGNGIY